MPATVNAQWMATLGDEQLVAAEAHFYTVLRTRDIAEKIRTGSRYLLLQAPLDLDSAWHRWLLVNNETRARGVATQHRRDTSERARHLIYSAAAAPIPKL